MYILDDVNKSDLIEPLNHLISKKHTKIDLNFNSNN